MRWDALTEEARCWGCGKMDEPPPWARVCIECGHTWKTDADLVKHDQERRAGAFFVPLPRTVEEILSCPCCAHDF